MAIGAKLVAATKPLNTHAVTNVGVGLSIAGAIGGAVNSLSHLLGDWKFDVDLGHAVRTGIDPNHDIAQVVAPVLVLTVMVILGTLLAALGLAPQIRSSQGAPPGGAN